MMMTSIGFVRFLRLLRGRNKSIFVVFVVVVFLVDHDHFRRVLRRCRRFRRCRLRFDRRRFGFDRRRFGRRRFTRAVGIGGGIVGIVENTVRYHQRRTDHILAGWHLVGRSGVFSVPKFVFFQVIIVFFDAAHR